MCPKPKLSALRLKELAMSMPRVAIVYGVVMILLGVVSYGIVAAGWMPGHASRTAFIPTAVGIIFVVLGALSASKAHLRKHLMHAGAALALLSALAGFDRAFTSLRKAEFVISDKNVVGLGATLGMGLLSALFVLLCVKSFRDARRKGAI
jgi:hypothetical protein